MGVGTGFGNWDLAPISDFEFMRGKVMERKIGQTVISAQRGDITDLQVEAIVNAANTTLKMAEGVGGAIKGKGGQAIEDEAVKKGPIPVGEAVITGAGKLKAKHVIHAAVTGPDLQTDGGKVHRATRNALIRAQELGIRSLAFPALVSGVGGFPFDECARAMVRETWRFVAAAGGFEKIIFCVQEDAALHAFEDELKELGTGGR